MKGQKIKWQGGLEFPKDLTIPESIEFLQHLRMSTGFHLDYTHKRRESNHAGNNVFVNETLNGRFSKGYLTLTPEAVFPYFFESNPLNSDPNAFLYFLLGSKVPSKSNPTTPEEMDIYAKQILESGKIYLDLSFPNERYKTHRISAGSIEESMIRQTSSGAGRLVSIALGIPLS